MDWPFDVFVQHPPRRIAGIAEIVGDPSGNWEVGQVYVSDGRGFRHADVLESRDVRLSLFLLAMRDIGRAYRKTMEGTRRDYC